MAAIPTLPIEVQAKLSLPLQVIIIQEPKQGHCGEMPITPVLRPPRVCCLKCMHFATHISPLRGLTYWSMLPFWVSYLKYRSAISLIL
jgi:hypothetical protein